MPIQSIGDMSQGFQSSRHTGNIKSQLQQLSQELASGKVSDVTQRLGGKTSALVGLDREIALLDALASNTTRLGQTLGYMQATLDVLDGLGAQLQEQTLRISVNSSAPTVDDAAHAGRVTFESLVVGLNKSIAGRRLFAGTEADGPALASAEDMLADLVAAIGPATDAADISLAIETWFEDPAGGFATMGYLGDSGAAMTRRISAYQEITIDARADDPAVRAMLRSAATAAVADVMGGNIDATQRALLVQESGQLSLASSAEFTQLRARVGDAEGRVANATATQAAERTAFEMSRNDILRADPFETATKLQDVQTQLEIHYNVTARLSRLSLSNYLR